MADYPYSAALIPLFGPNIVESPDEVAFAVALAGMFGRQGDEQEIRVLRYAFLDEVERDFHHAQTEANLPMKGKSHDRELHGIGSKAGDLRRTLSKYAIDSLEGMLFKDQWNAAHRGGACEDEFGRFLQLLASLEALETMVHRHEHRKPIDFGPNTSLWVRAIEDPVHNLLWPRLFVFWEKHQNFKVSFSIHGPLFRFVDLAHGFLKLTSPKQDTLKGSLRRWKREGRPLVL